MDATDRPSLFVLLLRLIPIPQVKCETYSSHIKMALTRTTEVIPFVDGRLCLGTWQGVFLWEHRARSHRRRIVLSYIGDQPNDSGKL